MPGALPSLARKYLIRFYQLLLNLYPRQYRIKFGREMQAVFSEIIFSNNDSSKTAVIFGRKLRDLPLSLARSWMEVLPFHCIYSVGFEDPVEKEIRAFYRKQKLRRVGRIGATLVILAYSLSKPTIAGSVYRKAKFTLEGSPIGCVSLVWQVQGNLHLQSIFWATTQ